MKHALIIVLGLFIASLSLGQTRGQRPAFDVASVRPSNSSGLVENHIPTLNAEPGHNLTFANTQLIDLIMLAYGVGASQISGPDWLTDRFNVIATVPENATKEQIPLMLRALLESRFKLSLHSNQKTIQVYSMEIAGGGLKMHETPDDDRGLSGCDRSFAASQGATLAASCHKLSAAEIAQRLQSLAPSYFRDGPVIDSTALKATYDFKLEWEPAFVREGPSIFDAVESQLGLKLVLKKRSMGVLIIDHCEKTPTEN